MQVIQEELQQRQAVLHIEVESADLERYLDRAHRRVVQRVTVPGFRRGKAPRSIVERLVGRDVLLEEALELLLPEVTAKAVEEQGLEMAAPPRVEVVSREPMALRATVPLPPEVTLGDYRQVRIAPEEVEVDEERVAETLEEIRRETTPWEPVDRPVSMGDQLVMDLRGSTEGRELISQRNFGYIVSEEPSPVPGFGAALEGMQQGETREFTLPFPDDYSDAELAGKPCEFVVEAKEIKGRELPDMDDEFARSVGQGYDSLEALREDVRGRLRASLEAEAHGRYEEKVLEEVLATAQIEMAPLLVERETERLQQELRDRVQSLVRGPVGVDEYMSLLGKTAEEVQEELRPRAEMRLQRSALLNSVADAEGCEASDEAVNAEIEGMVQEAGPRGREVRRHFSNAQHREMVARSLRTRKALELLVTIARGEEGQEEAASSEETASAPSGDESSA